MPLRQSTLKFGYHTSSDTTLVAASIVSSEDQDTIIVAAIDSNLQLPTPSESATDVSSESSQAGQPENRVKSRSKRLLSAQSSKTSLRKHSRVPDNVEHNDQRAVSGETLVHAVVVGITGDLEKADSSSTKDEPFHEDTITLAEACGFFQGDHDMKDAPLAKQSDHETSSVIIVREDSEDEELREAKWQARKVKMEENARKWEKRKKAADESATRRSGRALLVSKTSEILSNIKKTVLGKRTRDPAEDNDSHQRPCSTTTDMASNGNKRTRTIETGHVTEAPKSKKETARRGKKWLTSGLFAGQPRMFDARLTENKNKRKSKASEEALQKDNTVLPLPMFAGERLLQYGRDFKLPFDVFSPLPAGQPKPDEWKKVNKNVFVGDAAAEWRTHKFIEHSTCVCTPDTGCDQDCMNRYMYYECDEGNCNLGAEPCGNRAFDGLKLRAKVGGKYNVGVEVIKTADRGYGVRSNRTFMPNQIIVEYTGEIITQEECERRMRTIYKDNECYYLMLFDQNMIIDATRGSIARFVNHSCEPNCRMEKWTVGGKPRMALFAGERGVMTGEELTYDYNFDPYSQKNVQVCRCGAKTCRGVLGPKPKPEAKRVSPENEGAKKKSGKVSSAKRKVAQVLQEKTTRIGKKGSTAKTSKKQVRSPVKVRTGSESPKKAVLIKKVVSRKVSLPKTTAKLGRSDSKLKKLLVNAKTKTGSFRKGRVIGSSPGKEALYGKKKIVARPTSLKERAKVVAKSVRRKNDTISVAA